jgi:hypothetical protein
MKTLALCILSVMMISCSVEQRIHRWSYTNEWHYEKFHKYQVYKTLGGRKYIIVINENKLMLKRKYLKGNERK